MPPDEIQDQSTQKEDRVANLQAEFARKFENQAAEVKKLADANAALASQLKQLQAPPHPKQESKEEALDELFYKDPAAHAAKIKEMTKTELRAELKREQEATSRMTNVINSLGRDYPEFNDPEAPLTRKTLEIFGAMDESEKKDPKAIRIAALEAAQELGVKPRSKRTDDESFSFGGGGSDYRPSRQQQKNGKLDPRTEDFAALVGINLKDPKVAERLKARAQRTNYRNYQSNK